MGHSGELAGKVVVVSGLGPGLGREVVRLALDGGARVVAGDLDGARMRSILGELDADADRTAALELDLRSLSACEALIDLARSRFGRLDGVVHVAALDTPVGGLLDGGLDDWPATADVNVKGTLQLTKLAVPMLQEAGGGSVVMVGSIAAAEPVDGVVQLAYGMSKAALAVGAYYLSRELGPFGIRVNTVAPGWKWGPTLEVGMAATVAETGLSVETLLDPVRERISLRRFATDVDVAQSIVFLLGDRAAAITGQTLYVDGGILH